MNSFRFNKRQSELVALIVLAVVLTAIFAPMVVHMVSDSSDYAEHIRDAISWVKYGKTVIPRPHFLYHALLIIAHYVAPSIDFPIAAMGIGTVFYVFLGMVIYATVRPLFQEWTAFKGIAAAWVVTLGLMVISAVTLPTLPSKNLYKGYIVAHTYHNPTMIILKPLGLLLFVQVLKIFQPTFIARTLIGTLFVLALLSTLAKPNLAICLVPALCLIVAYRWYRGQYVNWLALGAGVFVPVGIMLGYQYVFHTASGMGGFEFAPLKFMAYFSPDNLLLVKLVLSILFPLMVYIAYFQTARHDLALNLAWVVFIFGAIYMYGFVEPNEWWSGNFTWSGQVSLLILYIMSVVFFIRETVTNFRERGKTARNLMFWVCSFVLILHILSGIIWYIAQYGDTLYAWW